MQKQKRYYISVSGGLLKDKHRERMGVAIWEYLWCLDKTTKIDKGYGLVLGGRPIKITEILDGQKDRKNVSVCLRRLRDEGYITLKRTPYGYVIKVVKAQKWFGRKVDYVVDEIMRDEAEAPHQKEERDVAKSPQRSGESTTSIDEAKPPQTKKTIHYKVKDNTNSDRGSRKKSFDPLGADIIKAFEEVDPKNKTYYGNTTQRKACDFLIQEHGLEQTLNVIREVLPHTNKRPRYEFPHISTPHQLMENWVKLKDSAHMKQQEKLAREQKHKVAFSS